MKKFKEILNEDAVLGLLVCGVANIFFAIAAIL
jgi:hypothetical protein